MTEKIKIYVVCHIWHYNGVLFNGDVIDEISAIFLSEEKAHDFINNRSNYTIIESYINDSIAFNQKDIENTTTINNFTDFYATSIDKSNLLETIPKLFPQSFLNMSSYLRRSFLINSVFSYKNLIENKTLFPPVNDDNNMYNMSYDNYSFYYFSFKFNSYNYYKRVELDYKDLPFFKKLLNRIFKVKYYQTITEETGTVNFETTNEFNKLPLDRQTKILLELNNFILKSF